MKNQLKFNNGKLRIMLVGDPHENPNVSTAKEIAVTEDYYTLQANAVEKLKPDLVVLLGDNARADSPEALKETLLRITKAYRENEVPFTFVLGNHDLECEVDDIFTQYDIYRELPFCVIPDKEDVSSYGDFNVTIKSSDEKKDVLNLWLMFSGNRAEEKYHSYYDFVKDGQMRWYEEKANQLKEANGEIVPAILFQHIPVPEEYDFVDEKSFLSMIFDGVTGLNGTKGKFFALKKDGTVSGYMGEAPCAPDYNNGQFDSWKKTGDIFAAFFGHDHMNDFIGMTQGIILGQCKLSGFRQYGDGMMQGVRIIDIKEDSPTCIETKMHHYRELVGPACNSIPKELQRFPDRINCKIEFVTQKLLPVAAAVALPFVTKKIIKTIKKSK
ncbi:MAG: metallophosphoesterase [Clostridia bacterium]|nr:metallophosphoesterase [Clostridia bacterium]